MRLIGYLPRLGVGPMTKPHHWSDPPPSSKPAKPLAFPPPQWALPMEEFSEAQLNQLRVFPPWHFDDRPGSLVVPASWKTIVCDAVGVSPDRCVDLSGDRVAIPIRGWL